MVPPGRRSTTAGAAIALLACAAAAAAVPSAGVAAPPVPRWRTMVTPHFRIHYYDEEEAMARRAAFIAERAHGVLTRTLNWRPGGRIDITLTDQTDSANGFANAVPYNYLFGFGVPPESLSSLNDFDDWLAILLIHEITHVVHLDITLGLSRVVNFLLGKTLAPNGVQPNWFVEGLAVVQESSASTGGRIRSSVYDMFLRTAVLDGKLFGLDHVSNGPRAFPHGTAAYLYGSSFLKYVEDRFGAEKLTEIAHRYGSRVLPFGLNRAAREATGFGFDELWDDWSAALSRKYRLQADEARRRGLTPAARLTYEGEGGGGQRPRFLRDGNVVYQMASSYHRPAFMRIDPVSGRRTKITDINGASHPAPTPDGGALLYQQTNFQSLRERISGATHADWDDLFRLDLATGATRRLTNGQRAHEPDVSPDGARVVFSTGARQVGALDLAIAPMSGGAATLIARTGDRDIVYTPSWSPDGGRIAYSRWKVGGLRDIHVYDVATEIDRPLWVDRAIEADPRFTPDGRFIVFASDRTGIYNIYAHEVDSGRLYQVTNVLGGAFQPDVSPDGARLVFVGFSSAGYDLYTMPFDSASWLPAEPFVNPRSDAALEGAAIARPETADGVPGQPEPTSAKDVILRVDAYNPWRYMYPRAWNIVLSSQGLGLGPDVSIGTVVSDPVGNHGLGFQASIPASGDLSVRADYNYYGLWPSFSLSASRATYLAYGLVVDNQERTYRERSWSVNTATSFPVLRKPDSYADVWMGYGYRDYYPVDGLSAADPTQGITRAPSTGPFAGFFLGWFYSNVQGWNYSISGQEGRRLQVTMDFSDPAVGSRFRTAQVGWRWTEFWTPPWAKLQALAVSYSGGAGIGDTRGIFRLGGFVQQDLVRSFFLNQRQCCLYLRGYAPGSIVGDQYQLLSVEYRAPLLWFERGYKTFPMYFRRLHGALFADVGNAYNGDFRARDLRAGVGAELRIEFKLGYYIESLLQIGAAKGLSKDGITDYYMVTAFPF